MTYQFQIGGDKICDAGQAIQTRWDSLLSATLTQIILIAAMHGDGVARARKIVIALLAGITGIQEIEIE